ncbi:sodium:solute symporter [Pseudomonas sp. B329]|uniref:sodium:solute symporter family protein n=1 Tax=Pseudomonas sp. B329 TaxID=1553459 RepID=UPI002003B446|nr:sodium:solute symporter [Pseudomonas sp. B329]MCK3863827.1 sodium:solute symporter [Pseudomonas sp. B329]
MLSITQPLPAALGWALIIGLGIFLTAVALIVRSRLVRNTKDYIIANRKVGLGFSIGAVIAVWTWSMAIVMSAASAYTWGLSGLLWFTIPNGIAIILLAPLALRLRKVVPNGYTIPDYIRTRLASNFSAALATLIMLLALLFSILINLKGTVLVTSAVFGLKPLAVVAVVLVIVTLYSYLGGLWTSTITGTLNTLLILVPLAVIVLFALEKIGGAEWVFNSLAQQNAEYLSIFSYEAAAAFGLTLSLGLLGASISDQSFWQKAWAVKPRHLSRTFIWGGALFYPIPIIAGILGLVGLGYGVTLPQIGGDAASIGPYVIANIGLPVTLVALYVFVVLNCSYSTIDGAFSAISSLVSVNVLMPLFPRLPGKALFTLTKLSMVIFGVIAGAIVMSGWDFVSLVLLAQSLNASILFPLLLAISWHRTTAAGFSWGIILAVVIGMSVRHFYGELAGILTITGISAIVPLTLGLMSRKTFNFDDYSRQLQASNDVESRVSHPA